MMGVVKKYHLNIPFSWDNLGLMICNLNHQKYQGGKRRPTEI